jgi:enediyne biosynthesis protein E4
MNTTLFTLMSTSLLLLAACVAHSESSGSPRAPARGVATRLMMQALNQRATPCTGNFNQHLLEHTTQPRGGEGSVYDSNGSGVALGDLDGDGLPEIVLGNLDGSSTIQWNEGHFKFRVEALLNSFGLPETQTRAVALVDVDGDGWLDIVFTHTQGGISLYTNDHHRHFVVHPLERASFPAFTMLWDDLSGTGNLDLVTASYDAILESESKGFLFSNGGGVVVYKHQNGTFNPERLWPNSQTLAMTMFDVNNDGRRDLIIGNDFAVPDFIWLNTSDGWKRVNPFKRITKNTMGFSVADTDNDGSLELFATDMKPKFDDVKVLARWMPFMQKTYEKLQYASTQRAENVLQRRNKDGSFQNVAYDLGIDATGWSWSAKFGDLDNDGFEDLYVVNGMIDKENLKYLPHFELVETNKVFKNSSGHFSPVPDWKLGSTSSGRGMGMTDLDNDGRLDIVINNVSSPAQVFENQLCGGQALGVELNWAGTHNTKAIGATLKLHTSTGTVQREVVSQGGYLSGNDPRLHFGVPEGATLNSLEVIWPDGAHSSIENPTINAILKIARDGSKP